MGTFSEKLQLYNDPLHVYDGVQASRKAERMGYKVIRQWFQSPVWCCGMWKQEVRTYLSHHADLGEAMINHAKSGQILKMRTVVITGYGLL